MLNLLSMDRSRGVLSGENALGVRGVGKGCPTPVADFEDPSVRLSSAARLLRSEDEEVAPPVSRFVVCETVSVGCGEYSTSKLETDPSWLHVKARLVSFIDDTIPDQTPKETK